MNVKPFNLEAAKAGKSLCRIDGRKVKFIAHVPEANDPNERVVLGFAFEDGSLQIIGTNESGQFGASDEQRAKYEEMHVYLAPEKKTAWINLYAKSNTDSAHGFAWPSRQRADLVNAEASDEKRIACVEVTYEEGQGL